MYQWDRQENETTKAYEAFCGYRDLGTGRKLIKVSEKLNKKPALISRWANKHNWKTRADAWDRSVLEEVRQKAIKDRVEMLENQQQIGRMIYAKAVMELQKRDLSDASIKVLIDGIEKGLAIRQKALNDVIGENETKVDDEPKIIFTFSRGRNGEPIDREM